MKGNIEMEKSVTFNDILESAEHLSLNEQESLIDVLYHRISESRRNNILKSVLSARDEYKAGITKPAKPEELINEILS